MDADFERFMEGYQDVLTLAAGQTLTAEQAADIQFAFEFQRKQEEDVVDAFHRGYQHGLEVGAGADAAALVEKVDSLQSELAAARALDRYWKAAEVDREQPGTSAASEPDKSPPETGAGTEGER